MKKLLLASCCILFSQIHSQTLTQAFNEPKPGETESSFLLDTSAFSAGLPLNVTGNTAVWDYTKLKAINAKIDNNYVSASSVPSATNYPGCTFVQESNGIYSFFKSTTTPTTQTEILGLESSTLSAKFTNSGIIAKYPVTYGSSVSDNMSGTFSFSITGNCNGNIVTTADGLGTLNLPEGITLTNVLRVKSVQTLSFTALFQQIGMIRQTIYNYYHSSQKFPVLSINYNYLSTSFTSTPSLTGYATGSTNFFVTGIEESSALNASLQVYPNPAKDVLNIKSNGTANVQSSAIVNQLGQVVVQSTEAQTLDISGLQNGIYFIEIKTDKGMSRKKIIKE